MTPAPPSGHVVVDERQMRGQVAHRGHGLPLGPDRGIQARRLRALPDAIDVVAQRSPGGVLRRALFVGERGQAAPVVLQPVVEQVQDVQLVIRRIKRARARSCPDHARLS
jgi:hypothetical protein